MSDGTDGNRRFRYLFNDWEDELVLAAADAVECCITSAYLNTASIPLLRKIAQRLAFLSSRANHMPIRVLVSRDFAATEVDKVRILQQLCELPYVEARVHTGEDFLHRKNYIFKTLTDIRVVIGSVNITKSGLNRNLESAAFVRHDLDDPEAVRIQEQFSQLWESAHPANRFLKERETMPSAPKFQKGDNVRIISSGKIGTVNDVLARQNSIGYRVTVDGKPTTYQEKYLDLYVDEEQEILDNLALQDLKGIGEFHLFQTWLRLKRPMEGSLYSYLASRTVFNPYQFKPLSKFISPGSEERLFIADEVGVGKTIETGIILTELIARGRIDRRSPILIVCPNSLGPKWVKEMQKRFNLRFHLHDGSSLGNALRNALDTGYFPDGAFWAVASLQLVRSENYMSLISSLNASRELPLWSLVIVDEAHHMRNTSTESNNLGSILSGLTEMMLMLSATPLNLRDQDLFNQMHILNPSMFPDEQTFVALLEPVKSLNRCRRLLLSNSTDAYPALLQELNSLEAGPLSAAISSHPGIVSLRERVTEGSPMTSADLASYDRTLISLSPLDSSFTRALKREALEHRVIREAMNVPVVLSPEEMEFHETVIELTREAYLSKGGSPAALGFITNMPRRMVSSCIPAMREYLAWSLENDRIQVERASREEDAEDDSELGSIPLPPELRERFVELQEQAERLSQTDSKYQQFKELVERMRSTMPNPQLMVFSFFVRTLRYLERRLEEEGYRVGLICGDVPLLAKDGQPGRYEIMEAFERNELDILLSSEVGGEGLDFQFCQAIVNYDLPYNPMRIEQRIGRIDRFGQKADKVLVASMYIQGTVDESIYTALYDRIRIVEDSVGILEPILGNRLIDLQKDIISGELTPEQVEDRLRDIKVSIEQAKKEAERFEESRRELMGDEYFTSPLHNLEKHADFVQPADAANLTAICMSGWGDCRYELVDEERGLITLSKEVRSRLEQFTRRPGSEGSTEELAPLQKGRSPVAAVFNGSLADKHRDHVFLPACGFWTKFMLNELEQEGRIHKVFMFRNSHSEIGLPEGQYLVPLFEVKMEGFRVELDLAAVPIKLADSTIPQCDFRKLSRVLGRNATECDSPFEILETTDCSTLIDLGREAIERQMEERMDLLRAENRYRIDARMESLEKGSRTRIERLERKISEHRSSRLAEGREPNPDFIRLTEAQIAVENRRTAERISRLRSRSELSMTLSLAAAMLLESV